MERTRNTGNQPRPRNTHLGRHLVSRAAAEASPSTGIPRLVWTVPLPSPHTRRWQNNPCPSGVLGPLYNHTQYLQKHLENLHRKKFQNNSRKLKFPVPILQAVHSAVSRVDRRPRPLCIKSNPRLSVSRTPPTRKAMASGPVACPWYPSKAPTKAWHPLSLSSSCISQECRKGSRVTNLGN